MSSDAEVGRVSEHLAIALNNELITEMEKRSMTSVPWVFDIDQIPIRCKWSQRRKEKALRKELTRVAQLEGHRTR